MYTKDNNEAFKILKLNNYEYLKEKKIIAQYLMLFIKYWT